MHKNGWPSLVTSDIVHKISAEAQVEERSLETIGISGGAYILKSRKDICTAIGTNGKSEYRVNLTSYRDTQLTLFDVSPTEPSEFRDYPAIQGELLKVAKSVDTAKIECISLMRTDSVKMDDYLTSKLDILSMLLVATTLIIVVARETFKHYRSNNNQ